MRIVVMDTHQATVEVMTHRAFWHGWSLTNRNVTHVWVGWAPSEDFSSVAVCDGSGDGNSHIERFSTTEIHVGGGLGEDFRESDRALVSTLRQAFGRYAETSGAKTDAELLGWFCDAPGREEFAAQFRLHDERKISLPKANVVRVVQ